MSASEWLRPPVASATGSGCGVWSPETSVGAEEEVRRLAAPRAVERAAPPELDAPVPSWPPELAPQL